MFLSPLTKKAFESQAGEGPVEAHRVEAKVKFSCMLALRGVSASLCSRDPLLLISSSALTSTFLFA